MSSTHLSLHYHVVFGTKHQRPLIAAEWRPRLHAYLGGAALTLDVVPEAIGGVADHIHLLIGLKATHRLADVMRDLKRASSTWIHETIGNREFQWQDGYAAFTVSVSMIETVRHYIAGQEEHHRQRTFQEE
ncbi:MAG TPA: IS200/IS605 family transposase, partial [Verrucomicrobiae bacterium]|nr:IS200/IS605 family transposase [Verrucomicrobiae bacterium]